MLDVTLVSSVLIGLGFKTGVSATDEKEFTVLVIVSGFCNLSLSLFIMYNIESYIQIQKK